MGWRRADRPNPVAARWQQICALLARRRPRLSPSRAARYTPEPPVIERNRSCAAKAADEIRTRDPELGKLVLYQLSYRRTRLDITRSARRALYAPARTLRPLPFAVLVKRLLAPIIASLLGAALLGLLIYGVSHQAPSRTLDQALADGQQPLAPQATHALPALIGGGRSSLAAYRGRVVVLNFWASWCPGCQAEASELERLQRNLQRHHRATVLGVTYEDITSDSLEFLHQYHVTFPNLVDGSGDFGRSYGTDQLPESFLIGPTGHVAAISREGITKPFVEHALQLASRA
jgi:cytochrome c biogenesis protein CcmG/thiol:disulfide interchange protein DsbE